MFVCHASALGQGQELNNFTFQIYIGNSAQAEVATSPKVAPTVTLYFHARTHARTPAHTPQAHPRTCTHGHTTHTRTCKHWKPRASISKVSIQPMMKKLVGKWKTGRSIGSLVMSNLQSPMQSQMTARLKGWADAEVGTGTRSGSFN